ncbi:hypothetical protein RF11_01428 [Thelohanellus kitauei]|uniref:Uncharacterized protein n=1 Tax=Thelohanellus kitauei TaxID=669202 RepID=A0A0C2MXP7_THEKT|nr:hypothetical protein RF11_01428 [Thelohanellus kitauei]
MLVYPLAILLTQLISSGLSEDPFKKTLNLNNKEISVEFDGYVEFSISRYNYRFTLENDKAVYEHTAITLFDFNSKGTELNIKFENTNSGAWCKIDCESSDRETELVIGACQISMKTGTNNPVHTYSISHKFRLRKIYQFGVGYYSITFKIDEIGEQFFGSTITSFVIGFIDFSEKCEFKNNDYVYLNAKFGTQNLVTPCRSKTEKWFVMEYPSLTAIPVIKDWDSDPKLDAFGFWTTRNIIIIFTVLMIVAISIIIILVCLWKRFLS